MPLWRIEKSYPITTPNEIKGFLYLSRDPVILSVTIYAWHLKLITQVLSNVITLSGPQITRNRRVYGSDMYRGACSLEVGK